MGPHLFYFPQFMKKDFFTLNKMKVIDVALGSTHTIILCFDTVK